MIPTVTYFSDILVKVLLHSLWQASIAGLLVWAVLRLVPARRANLRYGVCVAGLGTIVLATFVTWSTLDLKTGVRPDNAPVVFAESNLESSNQATALPSPTRQPQASDWSASPQQTESPYRQLTPFLSVLWLCGACLMLVRGLIGQVAARVWFASSSAENPSDAAPLKSVVDELCARFGLRRTVSVVVTDRLLVPAVLGTLWPVILVPPAMLTNTPLDQWKIIIAHELAHVRRWDAVFSLIQLVVESLLFFNPAVWWLSRQIRIEREACCDALAAEVCGQPLSVARALVDVASSVAKTAPTPGQPWRPGLQPATLAFADPSHDGDLSERVRRLVNPEKAPRSKISWLSLGIVSLAILIVGVLLQRGTDMAVQAAAKWMSPKERVEKLVQLEAERNGNIVPAAEGPVANDSRQEEATEDGKPGQIAVHLVVKTDDGSDVTPKMNLHSTSISGNHSLGKALGSPSEATPEYRKTLYYSPCQLRLGATQPGLATAVSPIVTLMPGDKEKTVELILKKGATVEIAVRNEQGEALPDAGIRYYTQITLRGSSSGLSGGEYQVNERGRWKMEHVGSAEYSFAVQSPGYQRYEFKREFPEPVQISEDNPLVVTLKKAQPTPVRVVENSTGQPIAGARMRITHRQSSAGGHGYGFNRRWDRPSRWDDYGVTDVDGRAVLDQLEDGTTYSFAVVADGYGIEMLDAKPGQPELTVKLSPPVTLTGKVTGAIERLEKQTEPGKTGYRFAAYSYLGQSYDETSWADVDDDGNYKIEGFSVGKHVVLRLPDEGHRIHLKEGVNKLDLEIKPAAGPDSVPRREVIIRLTGIPADAPARGTIYVSWQHPTVQWADAQNGPMPVKENEIRLTAAVGAQLHIGENGLVGYRIAEQDQIPILAGTGPQVISVPATAAGGIHGVITRADGQPAERGFVTIFATQLPKSEKNHQRINPSSSSGGSQYLRTVPLGGRYCVLAREETPAGNFWAVSEEVTVDENNPIAQVDIRLPAGRDLTLKTKDERGRPVVGQMVNLEVSFSLKSDPNAGFAYHITTETDATGTAKFKGLSADQPLGPVRLRLTAITKANPYVGTVTPIDLNRTIELKLTKGLAVSGVLIDSKSGKPIPDAELRIVPGQFDKATFKDNIRTKTDSKGQFHFSGLEPLEYTGYVEEASPKGTIVTAVGPVGLSFQTPPGVVPFTLDANSTKPLRWEVVIHPNGKLRPLD